MPQHEDSCARTLAIKNKTPTQASGEWEIKNHIIQKHYLQWELDDPCEKRKWKTREIWLVKFSKRNVGTNQKKAADCVFQWCFSIGAHNISKLRADKHEHLFLFLFRVCPWRSKLAVSLWCAWWVQVSFVSLVVFLCFLCPISSLFCIIVVLAQTCTNPSQYRIADSSTEYLRIDNANAFYCCGGKNLCSYLSALSQFT